TRSSTSRPSSSSGKGNPRHAALADSRPCPHTAAGMRWVVLSMVATLAIARGVSADEPALQALAVVNVGADQGVFVEAEDGRVLASVVADRAVHPASVTKVATTLALLERLGPDHRFETRV